MSEKHILVQGATCECIQGTLPDILKVASHTNEYANDKEGSEKLIATTLEIGQPFEKNTFGQCKLQPTPSGYKTCQPNITEWNRFYEDVVLKNGGNILTEDSQAICAIAGAPCIKIKDHGQITEPSEKNIANADQDVQAQLNPLVDTKDLFLNSNTEEGVEDKAS